MSSSAYFYDPRMYGSLADRSRNSAPVRRAAFGCNKQKPGVSAGAVIDQTKAEATKAALRDLWIGHVFWVRSVVVAALADNAAALQEAEKQVVANAQAIAASIEPFYGAQAKEKLFTLLAGHYDAVKAYLDASVAKNDGKQTEATAMLVGNAGEIASFLSSANRYLPKDT